MSRSLTWRAAVALAVSIIVSGASVGAEPLISAEPSAHAVAANRVGSQYLTKNVFVVSIDGLRGTEAFDAPDPAVLIPRMNELRAQGSLYRNFYNLVATWTTPGNDTIVDGCWEMTPNNEGNRLFQPACPTVFEYYRKANPDVAQNQVWAVVGKNNCNLLASSQHAYYGPEFAASIDPSPTGDRLDNSTWAVMRTVMDQYHPSLVFLHLGQVDRAGHEGWFVYQEAILNADRIVDELWTKIQSDPIYRDRTTVLVTTDHGRHDDEHGGFRDHSGISEGDKRLFLLALGPDIKAGAEFQEFRQQIDIAPTVGELLGFETPYAAGRVLSEMIEGYEARSVRPTRAAAWQNESPITASSGVVEQPDIALNAEGLHVVWVDDRGGSREIYYRQRSAGGLWSEEVDLSTSGREARAPSIAASGERVHVVWQDYRSGNWAIYYRWRDIGGEWSQPTVVLESVVEQAGDPGSRCAMTMEPQVAVCAGQVIVAVPLMSDRLRIFRLSPEGSWASQTVLDAPQSPYVDSFHTVLPQNTALATSDSLALVFWQQVNRRDWMLKYVRSGNAGLSWGPRVDYTFGNEHDVTVAAQGSNVFAAWIKPPHALWYQQSTDGGQNWPGASRLRTSGAWQPDLVAATGMVAMVWEDYRNGLPAIYLRTSANEGQTWDELQLSTGNSFSIEPVAATDGERVYVVWRDMRDGDWQLYLGEWSSIEPTPTASPTATVAPTLTATRTSTRTATASPTVSATATPTLTPTPPTYRLFLPLLIRGA